MIEQRRIIKQFGAGFQSVSEANVNRNRHARAAGISGGPQAKATIVDRLSDAIDTQGISLEQDAVIDLYRYDLGERGPRRAGSGLPNPSKSRSRVGRRGSSNHVVRSIAPLRTNRSAWAEMLRRYSNRSSANRTRIRSNGCGNPFSRKFTGPHHALLGEKAPRAFSLRIGGVMFPRIMVHDDRGFITTLPL